MNMAKVLIATLYSPDPVLLASNRLGPDRLILLIDHKPNNEQLKNLDLIQNSLGRVVDIKTVKTAVYDIVEVATKAVELIDLQPRDDELFINITSGRKTKALGLLFASYARKNRVSKIAYNPEEDKKAVIWLPKLAFKLTESQKKLLDELVSEESKQMNYVDLAKQVGISKAMLYRNIDELKDLGYISVDHGLQLTDAGKIARL